MTVKHRDVSTETGADLDAEGPLRRWARRRREVAREKEAVDEARRRDGRRDESPPPGDAREPAHDASEPAVVEEKVLTDEDMPPLESLDENSDYSGFLSSGVSESLRRRALRKLFSSAVFNIPDGLDDYDDDFTSFAALGDIVTSDMKHQAEVEAERAKRAQARAEPSAGADAEPREDGADGPAPDGASEDGAIGADAGPAGGPGGEGAGGEAEGGPRQPASSGNPEDGSPAPAAGVPAGAGKGPHQGA